LAYVTAIYRNKVREPLYIQNFDTFRDRVIQLARSSALKKVAIIAPLMPKVMCLAELRD